MRPAAVSSSCKAGSAELPGGSGPSCEGAAAANVVLSGGAVGCGFARLVAAAGLVPPPRRCMPAASLLFICSAIALAAPTHSNQGRISQCQCRAGKESHDVTAGSCQFAVDTIIDMFLLVRLLGIFL